MPRVVSGLTPVASVERTKRLNLALGLPLRNREALTNLLQQLYDPSNPNFHHFLTPQEFARQFDPTEQEYQSVLEFVRSNHFLVIGTHSNRVLLDVNGSVADIETAFHLKLRVYQHPTEQRKFYSCDVDPSLDASLSVLSISGLDDFFQPRPMDFRAQLNRTNLVGRAVPFEPPAPFGGERTARPNNRDTSFPWNLLLKSALVATGSGPTGTFLGSDFRAAYVPGVALDGSGESVGLVELDSYYPTDISDYEDLAGLRHVPLTNVMVNGFNRSPGPNNSEVALDIEMAISMAPGLASVMVYEGSNGNDILNRMATDNQARQLSCSWSFGHPVDPTREQILQQLAAQGQSFFQASGDAGAYDATLFAPADDPFVTAVGGTSLVTDLAGGAWASESAWSGSGGGVSPNYAIPIWQKSVAMGMNQGSLTKRNVPDVAALADAIIWVIANNGEQGTVGGTSAAAPLWAGFAALVNQEATARHHPGVGYINPAIYAIGRSTDYISAFHDIVSGNNTNAANPNQFFAGDGYDLCTGWGSPNGSNLINALLAPPDALQISPGSNSASGPVGGPFLPSFTGFLLTNASSAQLPWLVNTSANWMTVTPGSGVLASGAPPALISLTLTSMATNLMPGNYRADLWFTNLNNGFAQVRSVALAVATPPVITSQSGSLNLPVGATAEFTVTTATNAVSFFQWLANGTNLLDGPRITGANSPTLTVADVSSIDARTYSVLVSNVAGVTTSLDAALVVTSSPPIIAVQPVSQSALPGAGVTFAVTAFGDQPLSYQWHASGTNLIDGGIVSGSMSSALNLASISSPDARAYSVTVSNALGTRTSLEASLNIVSLTPPGIVQTSLHAFDGTNGANPGGLSRGLDGRIYGTTETGGVQNGGTIFWLDANDQPQFLYSFKGLDDGARPNGDLVQLSDGTLFGTTFSGGSNAFGTIFKLNTKGELSTIFALDRTNGVLPSAGLVNGADGFLYGSAYEGGIFHFGTVFRCDTNGVFTVLVPFASTNGAFPRAGLLPATDGGFLGTTYKGGTTGNGTVFRITRGGALSTVAIFDGMNGAFPVSALTRATDGSVYGTTTSGGAFGFGNVFRIFPDGQYTNLHSFGDSADGSHPRAALIQGSDGNFYGTTSTGGSFDAGTVFRMSSDGALTTIAQFGRANGANPQSPLLEDHDGSLLGVTQNGGPYGHGLIFRLSIPTSAPQITAQPASLMTYAGSTVMLSVASFGSMPLSYQWQKNGTNIMDTSEIVGSRSRTLILTNVTPANAGAYSVIVSNSFGSVLSSQAVLQILLSAPVITQQPTNLILSPGSTAIFHAHVLGNVPLNFQWRANGTNLADSVNHSGTTTDTLTIMNVTETDNGSYSLTITNSLGATNTIAAALLVVPVTAPGTRLNTLYSFTGGLDGSSPSELADGRDGFFYGTTEFGGDLLHGSVFKIGTNGDFVTMASFRSTNGAFPLAGLVFSTNGNVLGTASGGGPSGAGTVWSMSSAETVSNLYNFNGGIDGAVPAAKLIQARDGNFYGSTSSGGESGLGTIFRISGQAIHTVLHSFNSIDGSSSNRALIESAGGNFYGTTPSGGVFGKGSVFRISPAGEFTNIYSFTGGADGYNPMGALALGDDGALYGVTRSNTIQGFAFYGTIFRVTTNGALSTLYALNFTDGSYPAAGLLLASDGNFYGTTEHGGANDYGTLFRMTPSGSVSTLVEFDGFDDGANPLTALAQGWDSSLYGTTSAGGSSGHGTIFRLSFSGPPQITAQPVSQSSFTAGGAVFSVAATGAAPLSFQWQKNGTNLTDSLFIRGVSTHVLSLSNLTLADTGNYSVLVTNASGSVTSTTVLLNVSPAPPVFKLISPSGGSIMVSWSTVAGRAYQLQSTAGLPPSNWNDLGAPIMATGSSLQAAIPINTNLHRFYRVRLLP